ncbi:MAG TPA: helix-turn-helix domain-containing protein [Rhizomicrobium sp.]|jgi:transcriptional regulator with XRE-family HTH domain
MAPASTKILAQTLQAARERKGLSQRALAAKLGVRQSYISRIENAAVDPKASSLTEIARALDLELTLIPRRLVTAVRALQRQDEPNHSAKFEDDLRDRLNRIRRQIQTVEGVAGDPKALILLDKVIAELLPLRFGALAGVQIQTLVEQIGTVLKQIRRSSHPSVDKQISKEALVTIDRLARELRAIRNRLAHHAADQPSQPVPAYRLDTEDDHG